MVALLVQALHQSRLITFIIISFSFLTLFIIIITIIITIITVTFLFPLSMPLNSQALILGEHLSEQGSPWSARITCVSRGHLLSGSRSSSCLQFSNCSSNTLLVTFTVVKVEVVVMLERTTSTSITTITILQLLLLHTLGYLATGRDAN